MPTSSVNEAFSYSFSSKQSKHAFSNRTRRLNSGIMSAVSSTRHKAAEVQNLHCLFESLAWCFDEELRGNGCLVECPHSAWFPSSSPTVGDLWLRRRSQRPSSPPEGLPPTARRQCRHRRRKGYPRSRFVHHPMVQRFPPTPPSSSSRSKPLRMFVFSPRRVQVLRASTRFTTEMAFFCLKRFLNDGAS